MMATDVKPLTLTVKNLSSEAIYHTHTHTHLEVRYPLDSRCTED